MKTYHNLYNKICSLDNLLLAYRKAKKGKSKKWYVKKFEKNLNTNLLELKHGLETQTYSPKTLKRFIIRDPKTRVIHASHFRDRVVHHAICNIIEPIFDKTFIYDSYANRKNKGSLAAVNRFDYFQKKVSDNGRLAKKAEDNNMVIGYVLKADIKHYFNTVNHVILLKIIGKKIKDEKVLWLIKIILRNNLDGSETGMPIGNLTSQFFANVYLNDLDNFIKHKLKAKYYLRYVDDFVILHKNKNVLLAWKNKIDSFLKSRLKIELHEQKSQIYPLHKGIDLLGYRMFYHYRLSSKKNIRIMEEKLKRFEEMCKNNEISRQKIIKSVEGWYAYARHCNSYNRMRRLINNL